ncbi:MAG: glycosyltransferase family 9 protein [Deltaproteobacteria bacterium]|nr:glycosyltransferase family 9 protein [Deltaproteobacteria bacterium]MBW1979308.1 glycosyltransferase family 9 protein [Deltaproteobacteria bacterium]MBW2046458.1 glycosyltransferase family 9 protein [Deltaproteobacteria bacterium]MBW2302000.1 glycosyltransferase family 9 protein [Deltaproteobacteria bacterium]
MDIDLQRKIDRVIGSMLCRILSVFAGKGTSIGKDRQPSRFLVILLSEMGSLLLAYPMLQRIKNRYVNAKIYVLCFERNREFLEILDVIPAENIFTVRDGSFKTLMVDSIRALAKMRKAKIDASLDCELFSRISSIYSLLSGASIRVGFHPYTQEGLYRGSFINRPVLYNPYQHISQQFINLVEAIDRDQVPLVKRFPSKETVKLPEVVVEEEKKRDMLRRMEHDFPQISAKRLVLLYPSGGLLPIRAWPLTYFCEVARNLLAEGLAVGVIGMEADREMAKEIQSCCQSEACVDLTGYTRTLRDLLVLFHLAALLITNDGGPGHFASLTPLPAIIFYGPETPVLYGTLDQKSVHLYIPLTCSPCLTAYNHRNSPCDGDNVCLKRISPGQVLEKARQLLEEHAMVDTEDMIADARD